MVKGSSKIKKLLAVTGLTLAMGGVLQGHSHHILAKEGSKSQEADTSTTIETTEGIQDLDVIKGSEHITVFEDSDGHKLFEVKEHKVKESKKTVSVASSKKAVNEDTKKEVKKEDSKKEESKPKLSDKEVAKLVLNGDYGSGKSRRNKLESEGYDASKVQQIVNEIAPKPKPKPKQVASSETTTSNKPKQESKKQETTTQSTSSNKGNVIPAYPHNTFKSYMAYTALSTSSPQGQLSAKASADPSTAIMMYEGRYLVALGFAYADYIGEHIDIVMESGQVIPAIVGDWKAKEHTDQYNSASTNNGSIIEFIVSSNGAAGSAVNGSGNYNTIFSGKVKEFRK